MERTLEIKVVSARDLNNVNLLMKMDAYTVVKLIGDGDSKGKQRFKTPVDKEGASNPNWNFTMKFAVNEVAARENRLTLVFELRCQRNLGDKDIGEVYVPVKELLDSAAQGNGNSMQHLSYQVRKPSGNPQGVLNFSYKFGDNTAVSAVKPAAAEVYKPVSAYPAAPPGPSSLAYGGAYPPPPQPEAYHPPPQPAAYPPPPQPEAYRPPPKPAAYPPLQPEAYPPLQPEAYLPPKPAAYPSLQPEAYPPPQPEAYPPPKPAAYPSLQPEAYPPPPQLTTYPLPPSNFYPVPPPNAAAPLAPETGYSVYSQSYSAYMPTPPQPGYGYVHQPPPATAAYGYPPPTYGYPPPPGYYQPPAQNKNTNKNMGLGLGAGLIGGLVGGLLIGDLVSDAEFGDSLSFDL